MGLAPGMGILWYGLMDFKHCSPLVLHVSRVGTEEQYQALQSLERAARGCQENEGVGDDSVGG